MILKNNIKLIMKKIDGVILKGLEEGKRSNVEEKERCEGRSKNMGRKGW